MKNDWGEDKKTNFVQLGITLRDGDCFDFLPTLADNSVHLVLTDPPYFIDKLDDTWNDKKISITNSNTVGNLPAGMKFSPEQSINFGKFFEKVAKEVYRILVPGGFFIFFKKKPPIKIFVHSSRVTCSRNGDKEFFEKSSPCCYAWYVWQKDNYSNNPVIDWIK